MSQWTRIVDEMMGNKELPDELYHRLSRIDKLCSTAGGELWSRQIIAMVIEQYEREEDERKS